MPPLTPRDHTPHRLRTTALYTFVLLREFRYTLLSLAAAIALGTVIYRVYPAPGTPTLSVVVLEKQRDSRQLTQAKELGAAVLTRDMKEDQALIDAGIEHARAIVICTNDDMANLEVALDSRRLNPAIRVVMRLFDQKIAAKIAGAVSVDAAFSSSALAAPMVAALSLKAKTLSSYVIAGVPHV